MSRQPPLQTAIDSLYAGEFKTSRLMARLVADKVSQLGGPDLSTQIDMLQAQIEKKLLAGQEEGTFTFDDGSHVERSLDMDFTKDDYARFEEKLGQEWEATYHQMLDLGFAELISGIREQADAAVENRAKEIEQFERRLRRRWQKPMRLLAMQIGLTAQFGEETNDWLRSRATPSNGATVEALTRLHARATQVAGEVEALLKSGYADGAISRWRTIHELAMVAYFIHQHGNEVAQRYLDHLTVDSLRMARVYRNASKKLGYASMEEKEWDELQSNVNSLKVQYGEEFATEYGWAAKALSKNKPNFSDIEKAVEFDKLRPYYKMASDNVHAGPKAAFSRLGILPREDNLLLAGPSNAGLEEAGRLTAMSLTHISSPLMAVAASADGIVWLRILFELSKEIEKEFLVCRAKLLDDHSRINLRKSSMETKKPRRRLTPRQRHV
jgi:hypothetical protein